MKNIKVICFDFDDTLVPEIDYIKSGFYIVANYVYSKTQKYSVEIIFEMLLQLYFDSPENVFNRFNDLYLPIKDHMDVTCLVDIYKKHIPSISFDSNVIEVLKYLRKKEYKLAIISDGDFIQQKNKMIATNAKKYFDDIILTDSLLDHRKAWKPSQIPFEKLKKDFKVNYSNIVYIGDNPKKDFYIKKFLPIKTIRIINHGQYNNCNYKENIKEDVQINNLKELICFF